MRNPKTTWDNNLKNIKNIHGLHAHLFSLLPALDLSDILRAEYVLVVSAFDCYIHDVVLHGMVEIFQGNKITNSKYEDFCIPISVVTELLHAKDETERTLIFNSSVKKILSKESYQAPVSIEYALGLICVKSVWSQIGKCLNMSAEDVKRKLSLIVFRRNKIAHESDIQNIVSMDKSPIERSDLDEVFTFLNSIVGHLEVIRLSQTSYK